MTSRCSGTLGHRGCLRRAGRRCLRRAGRLRRLLPANEALQLLDLLQVRHEDGVGRIARQLGADAGGLRSDERDAFAADEIRACAGLAGT